MDWSEAKENFSLYQPPVVGQYVDKIEGLSGFTSAELNLVKT
jgi:hypothetical protein